MALPARTPIPAVPIRTPTHHGSPNQPTLTRPWMTFFEELVGALDGFGGYISIQTALKQTYDVPIVGGIAYPDASQGTNILTLTAMNTVPDANNNPIVTLARAANYVASDGAASRWSLIVLQDPNGAGKGFAAVASPDNGYYVAYPLGTVLSPNNTQTHIDLVSNASGNTWAAGPPAADQPIPPQ